jgi:hypothetical protein
MNTEVPDGLLLILLDDSKRCEKYREAVEKIKEKYKDWPPIRCAAADFYKIGLGEALSILKEVDDETK